MKLLLASIVLLTLAACSTEPTYQAAPVDSISSGSLEDPSTGDAIPDAATAFEDAITPDGEIDHNIMLEGAR